MSDTDPKNHEKNSLQLSTKDSGEHISQPPVLTTEKREEFPEKSAMNTFIAVAKCTKSCTQRISKRRLGSGGRGGSRRRANIRPRKSRGGWKATTGLKWADVKEISNINHYAAKAGKPLNTLVSIRPPSDILGDADRKKLCYRRMSHLGQKLKRLGFPVIGLRIFEKEVDGLLHVHVLMHVPRSVLNDFSTWGDGIITDIRPSVSNHISYITKQRLPLPPDLEGRISHKRRRGASFKGRRWSLTPDAKALITGCEL